MYQVEWAYIDDYSLREAAATVGIEASLFERIKNSKFEPLDTELRKLIASTFMAHVEGEWARHFEEKETKGPLSTVKNGVHVVTLGRGYEIDYGGDFTSPVLYIGKGDIKGRIQAHVQKKLFEFWLSAGAIPFRFFLTSLDNHENPAVANYSLESHLLVFFDERRPEERITPLLNKKMGPESPAIARSEFAKGWERPL